MPTPRNITQVSQQVRVEVSGSGAGAWIPATVTAAGSEIDPTYGVSLGGVVSNSVVARSIIDDPIQLGDLVWVVNTGTEHIIVGRQ